MYSNKIAVAIKANGKALREFEDQVYLPFQTEYSIFVKNKNSVRASVKIEIDGVDATQGVSLVVNPNDEIELERFIKNGNLSRGNRFKFIERTTAVERHRGTKVEDGLVRVEFQFEKPYIPIGTSDPDYWKSPYTPCTPWTPLPPYGNSLTSRGINGASGNAGINHIATDSYDKSSRGSSVQSLTGITAPGSVSDQEFRNISNFALEPQKHVIILHLLGEHLGKSVSKTVTTRSRTECSTCGHLSKSTSAKFCSQCGASLQIIY